MNTSRILTTAFEKLSFAKDLNEITAIVAASARQLSGADGATFVLRDNDLCYYVDESSVSPLWKGQKFPIQNCISGWSMIHQEAVVISDIYQDNRIPHDAYRPTFVKSLCMIPIRVNNPLGVIGNYWSNDHVPSSDEIKSLQILANSTAIALENLELKLVINTQTSEQKDLQDRTQELEMAMHTMAHDLRTPVAGMTGMAELIRLRMGNNLDSGVNDCLQAIVDTGLLAAQQIEQMLVLYRAVNGQIKKENLNLSSLAQELINMFQASLHEKPVQFYVQPNLSAYADIPLTRVVLGNLLSNALKYSAKKSKIKIDVGLYKTDPEFHTFFVRDNGDGFDQSQASKLFQPLSRLHSDLDFAGTGLGLASVAKIIKLHGGTMHAEGKPTEGATFYFSLPRLIA